MSEKIITYITHTHPPSLNHTHSLSLPHTQQQQTLALVLTFFIRRELSTDNEYAHSHELHDLLPPLPPGHDRKSAWSTSYDFIRRKYEDFDY